MTLQRSIVETKLFYVANVPICLHLDMQEGCAFICVFLAFLASVCKRLACNLMVTTLVLVAWCPRSKQEQIRMNE